MQFGEGSCRSPIDQRNVPFSVSALLTSIRDKTGRAQPRLRETRRYETSATVCGVHSASMGKCKIADGPVEPKRHPFHRFCRRCIFQRAVSFGRFSQVPILSATCPAQLDAKMAPAFPEGNLSTQVWITSENGKCDDWRGVKSAGDQLQ